MRMLARVSRARRGGDPADLRVALVADRAHALGLLAHSAGGGCEGRLHGGRQRGSADACEPVADVSELTRGRLVQLVEQRLPQHAAQCLHGIDGRRGVSCTGDHGELASRGRVRARARAAGSGQAIELHVRLQRAHHLRAQRRRLAREMIEADLADVLQRASADQRDRPGPGEVLRPCEHCFGGEVGDRPRAWRWLRVTVVEHSTLNISKRRRQRRSR